MKMRLLIAFCCSLFSSFPSIAESRAVNGEWERTVFGQRTIRNSEAKPCEQVTERNVTVATALSLSTASLLEVDPDMRFFLGYCANRSKPKCAFQLTKKETACVTRYNWVPARTRSPEQLAGKFNDDKVLLPTACVCWLGPAPDGPVIVDVD